MLQIKRLSELDIRTQALADLKEIFFLTSSRSIFPSKDAKEDFFRTWTKYYLASLTEHVYLALSDGRLLGYLTGCLNSQSAMRSLRLPSLALFKDLFRQYPAHFHINSHPAAQSKGIGTRLLNAFIDDLKHQNIPGVHIVTAPTALNVNFYKKNGFDFTEERELKGSGVLFMGRQL